MLDESALIGILAWAALALALASALWGLLAPKPNRVEIDGRKRWTASGAVTLAMIVGGASISALSLWLQTALEQKTAAEQLLEQQARDALAVVTGANAAKGLAEIRQARAEGRAAEANDRAAALARETREVLRDLRLSRQVETGARDNLARTGQALTQIERVLQPLEPLTLAVTWELSADELPSPELTARMAVAGRTMIRNWERAQARGSRQTSAPALITIEAGDDLYPDERREGRASSSLQAMLRQGIFFELFAASKNDVLTALTDLPMEPGRGDLRLALPAAINRPIVYVMATGALRFSAEATIAPSVMGRSGAIISFPDMEKAVGVIWLGYSIPTFSKGRPVEISLRSASRSYAVDGGGMTRIPNNFALFAVAPLQPAPNAR